MDEVFDQAYRAWWDYCSLSEVAESSSNAAYVENPYFEALVRLGRPAVPYMLGKIRDSPEAHFLAFALERIGRSTFPDDPPADIAAAVSNQELAAAWAAWWKDRLDAQELALLRRLETVDRR